MVLILWFSSVVLCSVVLCSVKVSIQHLHPSAGVIGAVPERLQSGHGDLKAVGGGYWRLEIRLGRVGGYGNAFGVESGPQSWRRVPPPPPGSEPLPDGDEAPIPAPKVIPLAGGAVPKSVASGAGCPALALFEPAPLTPHPTDGPPNPPSTRGGLPPQKVNTHVHPDAPTCTLSEP